MSPSARYSLLFGFLALGSLAACSRKAQQEDQGAPSAPAEAPWFDSPFQKEATPPPREQRLPPYFEDPDFRIEVSSHSRCEPKPPFLPPAGHDRLQVTLTIRAKTKRVVPVGPLGFRLEDSEGRRYSGTLAGCAPALPTRELSGSDSAEGAVHFDLPQDAKNLRLLFEPFLIGRPKVSAYLGLER